MTETKTAIGNVKESNELDAIFGDILQACGNRTMKEKISILYLTIDHIFQQHPEYSHLLDEKVIIH